MTSTTPQAAAPQAAALPTSVHTSHDIEHVEVFDDPRSWSKVKKVGGSLSFRTIHYSTFRIVHQTFILLTIFSASMIAGLNSNLYNRRSTQRILCLAFALIWDASSCHISDQIAAAGVKRRDQSEPFTLHSYFGVFWNSVERS